MSDRTCNVCDETKNADEFYQNTKRRRYEARCKVCYRKAVKDKRRRDPQATLDYARQYRDKNRKRLKANFDPVRAAEWRFSNSQLLIPRLAILFSSALQRARVSGVEFNITKPFVQILGSTGVCSMSGLPFVLEKIVKGKRNPFAPSIDRIDNEQGYTFLNSRLVCNMYNAGKGEASDVDFISMCVAVADRHRSDPRVIARLAELRNGL